jgi:hypothetical protein
MMRSRLGVDYGFVLRTRATADRELHLSHVKRHVFVNDFHQVLETACEFRFRVPAIDQGSALSFTNQHPCPLEFFQIPLHRIQRNFKVGGNRPSVGFSIMVKMQQNRFGRPASEQFSKCRRTHDLDHGSYDPNFKSIIPKS